jgi:hypothetical protein
VIRWLKANPQVKVEVEGHCDERGTNEYNLALGAKRAESNRYLIDLGISPDRLRPSVTAKSFLCAESRMKLAGQRIGAADLSSPNILVQGRLVNAIDIQALAPM